MYTIPAKLSPMAFYRTHQFLCTSPAATVVNISSLPVRSPVPDEQISMRLGRHPQRPSHRRLWMLPPLDTEWTRAGHEVELSTRLSSVLKESTRRSHRQARTLKQNERESLIFFFSDIAHMIPMTPRHDTYDTSERREYHD